MISRPFKNVVLKSLESATVARLDLHPVDLPLDTEIEFPGNRINNLFFIEEGMASMTTTFLDGSQVEVALVGREGVLGASCLMGTRLSLNRVYIQLPGRGFTSRRELVMSEFKRGGKFQQLVLCALQAQFLQSAQTAGCNARHTAEQRFARWLLLCTDRSAMYQLPLSQEYMASMIGSRRQTVTVIAGELQAKGLIRYSRGRIHILDVAGIEKIACECYRVVRNYLADVRDYDDGTNA